MTLIYFGCAAYEIRRDARTAMELRMKSYVTQTNLPLTYAEIENARAAAFVNDLNAQRQADPPSSPYDLWRILAPTETGKLLLATAGLNTGIFALSFIPGVLDHFVHVPAISSNYTLFTSMFGHAGLLHLGANMWGLLTFAPVVARSRTFERSGSHLAAFYLSSGVFASLVQHVSTAIIPAQRAAAFSGGLGASGAIFSLIGVFALSYPDAEVEILFLPFLTFTAKQVVTSFALLDLWGLLFGLKWLRFAHGAHLGGLAAGAAYFYWDGSRRVWKPARRLAFKGLQQFKLI